MSLSRRRSLRRGTPGHDEIPRTLGIMPRHFLRRGIRTHNEIPRALGIMRPHHRDTPVGVTTKKKPGFFGSQAFLFISVSVGRSYRFYGAAAYSSKSHLCFEKPPFLWLFETQVASRREGNGKKKRGAQNLTFTPSLGIVLSVSVIGAVVARFVHTEEVTGSNPVSRTKEPPFQGTGVLLCPPGQTHRQQSTAADTTTRE